MAAIRFSFQAGEHAADSGVRPKDGIHIVCADYLCGGENYGKATKWFFETYLKDIQKLLIAPFDINCGNSL